MVTKEQSVNDLIKKARKKAGIYKDNILVTKKETFQWRNPLSFYGIGVHLYNKRRFFWRNPSGEIMIGIGFAYELMEDVEAQWESLLKNMITSNGEDNPMIFGGFSFDSEKGTTYLWEGFAEEYFILPKFLLKVDGTRVTLTTNIVITPEDNVDIIIARYEMERGQLIEGNAVNMEIPSINSHEEIEPLKWMKTVDYVLSCMKEESVGKVVLAREWRVTFTESCDSVAIIERLLEQQHTSYIFSFEIGEKCFIGATPERLMKAEGNIYTSMCLAGSIGKTDSISENSRRQNQLLHDKKNLQEHKYVVEMIREVMMEACEEVKIPTEPTILEMRNIFHLCTPVYGIGKENTTLLQMVRKLHPTPALGGFPQKKAVEMIRHYEHLDRGWYGAPIGWIDGAGDGEFAVAIRSGIMCGEEMSLFAGCGIVEGSCAKEEYEETKVKFTPMMTALGGEFS